MIKIQVAAKKKLKDLYSVRFFLKSRIHSGIFIQV